MLIAAAIGSLAFILTMLIHEGIGHGGVCLALGGIPTLYPVSMQCTIESNWMVAAGPLANVIAGVVLWLALTRRWQTHWRYFLWLAAAFNLLNAAGYLGLGAFTGFGDWAILLGGFSLPMRIAIGFGAALLYYGFMRLMASTPGGFPNLLYAPYLAAGGTAIAAASLSKLGIGYLLVAAAASFGANFGLLFTRDWGRSFQAFPERNGGWEIASLTMTIAYTVFIGRGLRID